MKPEHRPWFILACIAVAGGLIVAAVATRYDLVAVQPDVSRGYLLDRWTGAIEWIGDNERAPVGKAK